MVNDSSLTRVNEARQDNPSITVALTQFNQVSEQIRINGLTPELSREFSRSLKILDMACKHTLLQIQEAYR